MFLLGRGGDWGAPGEHTEIDLPLGEYGAGSEERGGGGRVHNYSGVFF